MATTENVKEGKKNGTAAAKQSNLPEGFQQIGRDRFMFKPEDCKGPLVGFLIGQVEIPAPTQQDPDRKFYPLVIKLTRPCEGYNREKEKVLVPEGEEMLVASAKLQAELGGAVDNPKGVVEVFINPKKKISIGGGKTMWTYDLGAGRIVPREGDLRLFSGRTVPALPATTGTNNGDDFGATSGEEDIPF